MLRQILYAKTENYASEKESDNILENAPLKCFGEIHMSSIQFVKDSFCCPNVQIAVHTKTKQKHDLKSRTFYGS